MQIVSRVWPIQVFWNFLGFFPPNIFNLWLAESTTCRYRVMTTNRNILSLNSTYAFLKNKFDEISFANILLVLLLLILMFDYSANNTYLFAIMSFCILAGFGIDNLLFRHYKSAPSSEPLEEYDSDIPKEFLENSAEPVVAEAPVTPIEVPDIDEDFADTAQAVSAPEENVTAKETPKAEDIPEEKPLKHEVPKFFETPLPMPKKHVKKTLDYTFEPSSELMKYDIDISPDDDFDIK